MEAQQSLKSLYDYIRGKRQVIMKPANLPNNPYSYSLFRDFFTEKDRIYRTYKGVIRESPSNKPIKLIQAIQLRQFTKNTPQQATLRHSYAFHRRLIQLAQKHAQKQNQQQLHKQQIRSQFVFHQNIRKCYDWFYQSGTYNLYIFFEPCSMLPLYNYIQAVNQSQLISICRQVLEAFIYIQQYMPNTVRFFDPLKDIYVDKKTMKIKLFGFGIQRDCISRSFSYLNEYAINQHPLSKAGQFLPDTDYWAEYERLNQGKEIPEEILYNFPPVFNEKGLPLKSRYPPLLENRDIIWSIGLLLFQGLLKRLPIKHQTYVKYEEEEKVIEEIVPQKYLQIQMYLREIAKKGLSASIIPEQQKQEWKTKIGSILYRIINGMLSTSNFDLGDHKQSGTLQIILIIEQLIFGIQQKSDQLQYWHRIFENMQKYYCVQKYHHQQHVNYYPLFSSCDVLVPSLKTNNVHQLSAENSKNIAQLLQISISAIYSEVKYLLLLPKICNFVMQQVSRRYFQSEKSNQSLYIISCYVIECKFLFLKGYAYMFNRFINILQSIEECWNQFIKQRKIDQKQRAYTYMSLSKNRIIDLMRKWVTISVQNINSLTDQINGNYNSIQLITKPQTLHNLQSENRLREILEHSKNIEQQSLQRYHYYRLEPLPKSTINKCLFDKLFTNNFNLQKMQYPTLSHNLKNNVLTKNRLLAWMKLLELFYHNISQQFNYTDKLTTISDYQNHLIQTISTLQSYSILIRNLQICKDDKQILDRIISQKDPQIQFQTSDQ